MNELKPFEKICFCLFTLIFILSYPLYLKAKAQSSAVDEDEKFDYPNRIYQINSELINIITFATLYLM